MDILKEKEKLIDYVFTQNLAYEQIGKIYNCSGGYIRKVLKKLKIELPKRRKINPSETFNKGKGEKHFCLNCGKEIEKCKIFCNAKCQSEYKHKKGYEKILNGDETIMRANYIPKSFKKDILNEQGNVCAICGIPPIWNGKELIFVLDHIDGRASNNNRDNLRCICPNCDSQLDTYKSKNKNSDRVYYHFNHR